MERRKAPRARHDSVLELYDASGRLLGGGRLVDVSAAGACFMSARRFAKGVRLRARVRLLGAGARESAARVVRVQSKTNFTLYGLEFVEPRRGSEAAGLPQDPGHVRQPGIPGEPALPLGQPAAQEGHLAR
jgi:hypothetical protein